MLADHLVAERSAGRRTLAGFDFPFGYPRGFAAALTGRAAGRAVWACARQPHHRRPRQRQQPFRGRRRDQLRPRQQPRSGAAPPPWRCRPSPNAAATASTRSPSAASSKLASPPPKPAWKLYTAGSVGGQVLIGLPALHRLLHDPRLDGIAAWPFDTGLAVPTLRSCSPKSTPRSSPAAVAGEVQAIRDAAQVRLPAGASAALDAEGALGAALLRHRPHPEETTIVANEEAWILGVGFEPALRAAAPRIRDDCFAVLPAGVDWMPVDTALDRLRAATHPVAEPETVPLAEAGGRILAAPLHAARANPPAANAAVDGYGFAHATLGPAPHTLPLLPGRAAAGAPFPAAVPPGHALRILTGALLPEGVDTVVLEEDVTATPATITFARGLKPRANTRPPGEDVAEGAEILAEGRRLAPQDLALAAATGLAAPPRPPPPPRRRPLHRRRDPPRRATRPPRTRPSTPTAPCSSTSSAAGT